MLSLSATSDVVVDKRAHAWPVIFSLDYLEDLLIAWVSHDDGVVMEFDDFSL